MRRIAAGASREGRKSDDDSAGACGRRVGSRQTRLLHPCTLSIHEWVGPLPPISLWHVLVPVPLLIVLLDKFFPSLPHPLCPIDPCYPLSICPVPAPAAGIRSEQPRASLCACSASGIGPDIESRTQCRTRKIKPLCLDAVRAPTRDNGDLLTELGTIA